MEDKTLTCTKENISKYLTEKAPGYFSIPTSILSLFTEAIPNLSEMATSMLKLNGEIQIQQLTKTLDSFNITLSDFFNFLSQNENIDFSLTKFEELKKDSIYQVISKIQEDDDMSTQEKRNELEKIWGIIDQADKKKRKRDLNAMLKNYSIKTVTAVSVILTLTFSAERIIKAVKTNHTKVKNVKAFWDGVARVFGRK